jgi:DNA-binding CsgD family transcriptional regulator
MNARISSDFRHSAAASKPVDLSEIYKEKYHTMDATPLKIVARFYDANVDEAFWPEALTTLGEAVDADAVALIVHDFDLNVGRITVASGFTPDAIAAYNRKYHRFNVWMHREETFATPGRVIEGHRIVSLEATQHSQFFEEWLRPADLFEHAFIVLSYIGRAATVLALARREGKGPFNTTAIAKLNMLAPELSRGLALGRTFRSLATERRVATDVLEALPLGIIFLDVNGRVTLANRIARRVLDQAFPLTTDNDGLAAEIGGRRLRLRDLVAQIAADDTDAEPYAFLVPRAGGAKPLSLLVTTSRGAQDPIFDLGPAAVLYIGDPEQGPLVDHTRVARLYGLSRAESRVAALLASGYRLDQAAEVLGVAYETVRKHLKQIFGKTGTVRQAELVRMLLTGPAGLSL